jgi:hypothetical protein
VLGRDFTPIGPSGAGKVRAEVVFVGYGIRAGRSPGPGHGHGPASPHGSPHAASPHATSPHATSPHATSPHATSPHATSPHTTSPHATPPHAASPHGPALKLPAGHGSPHGPTPDYDDYAGVDVRGKVVLAFRHSPREWDRRRALRNLEGLRRKALWARAAGAAALLVVTDPLAHQGQKDELIDPSRDSRGGDAGVPIVHVSQAFAETVVARAGESLAGLQSSIDAVMAPRSRRLGVEVELNIDIQRVRKPSANIIGMWRGSDPALAGEAVVIGAHYDHIGMGGDDSMAPGVRAVHPGADDNASGTSALLEIAQAYALGAVPRPKRSVVFIAFSGEELGLIGSSHYTDHPTLPLQKTVAMLNMDMIGRMRSDRVQVQGTDTARELRPLVAMAARRGELDVAFHGDGYGPSDHTAFYAKDIPVLFFFTGVHTDYHRPSDTWEKLNFPGAARVAQMVAEVAASLANATERPKVVKAQGSPHTMGRSGDPHGRGYGAYLGTVPDFAEIEHGVKLAGVRGGSPAEKAGLKGGDVIVSLGGVAVKNLYDLTFALRERQAGDEVEVILLRATQRITVRATLGQR